MSAPITLTGRLGADPELTFTNSGMAVAKMRVVTDRRVKKGDDWESVDTSWHNVTAFGPCAEGCADELRKGDLVIVVGSIKQREYETKEGEKRSVWEVTANHVGRDLSRPRKGASNSPSSHAGAATADPWALTTQTATDDTPPF